MDLKIGFIPIAFKHPSYELEVLKNELKTRKVN